MSAFVHPTFGAASSPGWRRALVALAVLWMLILWLYRDTALAMVEVWDRSETFAHAWVVPPISLWLAWRLRRPLLALDPAPASWSLLAFVPLGLLWLAGALVAVNPAKQYALVGMLVASVPAVLGWRATVLLTFPLGFLFFAVPAGDFLTPTLMNWTADVTVTALRLSGIPVYREGLHFIIPTGSWSVVEACSGMRYLIASVMVGTLFAYLNYRTLRRRLLFVGVSFVVPILANWLRAYMIVMLGHLSGNQLAVGADHLVYGWALFGAIIMALYWIGARWAQDVPEPPGPVASSANWPSARGLVALVAGAMLLVVPLWALQRFESALPQGAVVQLALSGNLPGGLQPTGEFASLWKPGFANTSAQARAAFVDGNGRRIGVYLGYYRQQNGQRKLVSSTNGLVSSDTPGWLVLGQTELTSPGTPGVREGVLLQRQPAANGSRQRLRVWQFYWVDGQLVSGDVRAKLQGAWGRLMGRGDDSAVILIFTDETDETDQQLAQSTLARFAADSLPALVARLDQTRDVGMVVRHAR